MVGAVGRAQWDVFWWIVFGAAPLLVALTAAVLIVRWRARRTDAWRTATSALIGLAAIAFTAIWFVTTTP